MYDTANAIYIASAKGSAKFRVWEEALFRTYHGNWFVYAPQHHEGVNIIPLTRQEALAWCEKHRAQDIIDKYFADLVSEA